jgi:hydrogenase maturation protease
MKSFGELLDQCLRGRVCFLGIGNVEHGDDGFGMRLAEHLQSAGLPDDVEVALAGTEPEYVIGKYTGAGFDNVIFLDAVNFDGHAGEVVLLNSREINARFPQVSTHQLSLGMLANYIESGGHTRVWLIGAHPASLKPAGHLSRSLEATVETLAELITGYFQKEARPC